jgi:hypothetical protein
MGPLLFAIFITALGYYASALTTLFGSISGQYLRGTWTEANFSSTIVSSISMSYVIGYKLPNRTILGSPAPVLTSISTSMASMPWMAAEKTRVSIGSQ